MGKAIKAFLFLVLMSAGQSASIASSAVPQAIKYRIGVYEGLHHGKVSCYAKVETYAKADPKDWYYSVGDDQIKIAFEPEFSTLTRNSIKLEGTFKSFKLGPYYQIPNMVAAATITPVYSTNADLILDQFGKPKAFSLVVKNRNYMPEFQNKNFVCQELKLVKYWPCQKPSARYENRGGWCVETNRDSDILF